MPTEHKDLATCNRTQAAAWGKHILYDFEAKKQDAQIMSWCCHICLNTVRKYQFGYSIEEKK